MRPRGAWAAVVPLVIACSTPARPPERRAELKQVGPASVQVVPAAGQLPYCLLFTTSERGVIRQLTMNAEHTSMPCKAGEPIGDVVYNIPAQEGKVRIYLLLSDQPLRADSIAGQVHELATSQKQFTAMDLRVSGQVRIETFDFTPTGARE